MAPLMQPNMSAWWETVKNSVGCQISAHNIAAQKLHLQLLLLAGGGDAWPALLQEDTRQAAMILQSNRRSAVSPPATQLQGNDLSKLFKN